ncbi:signal recognition particle 9 kDa protein-like [Clytia hemisphaerica]|uniref:signal recognition particle 9 kDa protein-like n=1 Tax=Clytia hemisphaerica TaxID=252671 RepID=UPI0034D473A9
MTYIENWEDFAKAAEQLFIENPSQARFCTKYRHCDGKLVIKMTDDKVCLKYRTDQAQDVKKLEKLNNVLMRHMTSK